MPIYHMKDKATGDVQEVMMPYSALAGYLQDHPGLVQVFPKFPGHADPFRLGRVKLDDGFNEVLKKIKRDNVNSTINTK